MLPGTCSAVGMVYRIKKLAIQRYAMEKRGGEEGLFMIQPLLGMCI